MKLKVGVVGLGSNWETRYGPALRALNDRFEVRAVCEPVAHRAKQVAAEFDALAEDGFQSLALREDVDAILLLSVNWYGPLPILAACGQGKAVYCAVALDLDLEQARAIKGRVESAGVAFTAEFPRRLAPATLRLKELIATRLGQPRLLFCHQRRTAKPSKPLKSHSNMRELIEMVDWCRYVVGQEPVSVVGTLHRNRLDEPGEDYQMLSLDFAPPDQPGLGALAQISYGRYVPVAWKEAAAFRPPASLQVVCQRGMAFIDLPATLIWFDDAGRHIESLESERPIGEQLLAQFYHSVTNLEWNTSSLEDAYRAYWITLQAVSSHIEGRRVLL